MDVQQVKEMIRAAALADDTVIIEGKHGVGKSDAAKQIMQEDNYHMETLFLSHQEVGDLIGTPHTIMDGDTAITTWSVPIWLDRMNKAAARGKKCMLFLDELNRAPLDVRQSAMQLVLERQIHEHVLPTVDNQRCLIVAACNPADEYQVDELDPALLDRFMFCQVEADAEIWLKWARNKGVKGGKGVNQVIRDFIAANTKLIHYTPADGGTGATPRSWTKLGDHLDNFKNIPTEIHFQIMKGKIGEHLAGQFYTFYNNYVDVVKMSDIEAIVEKNKNKYSKIEDLAEVIAKRVKKQEAVQKSELAQQFREKYTEDDAPDMLPMLAYLYAMEVEICVGFLKGFRKDDPAGFKKLVDIDTRLNDKLLFKRIVQSAERTD